MILDLGLIDYEEAYRIQKEFVNRRKLCEVDDSIIIAEHRNVFTIGRSGNKENLLVSRKALNEDGIDVLDVDRGGDITFHGPGQLVAYPIIDLRDRKRDLHAYITDLEDAAIKFLKDYSVPGERISGRRGVWVGGRKIAFIGIGSSNWVTYHGISVNINTDLKFFSMINPCGFSDIEATSLNKLLGRYIAMDGAKKNFLFHLRSIFNVRDAECAAKGPAELS